MRLRWAMVLWAAAIVVAARAPAAEPTVNTAQIRADEGKLRIDRNIYGHFAEHLGRCIYEGFWVGEDSPIPNTRGIRNDTVAALKKIKIPVLRWPGGCFADEYHWRDGIGPKNQRPSMINTHWGGVVENNHFGTHEFFDLCEQLGCEPYICGNVGSGTVREMQEWVEYITFDGQSPMANLRRANGREEPWKIKYWGVGNENWGCGGNMRPEYYADEYRRYATYLRNFSGNRLYKIACGPNGGDVRWTEVLMREVGPRMQGLALHFYCGSGKKSRSATVFEEIDWAHLLSRALHIDELIVRHTELMDRFDPQNRVALIVDEWGAWHAVEPGTNPGFLYQQNTLRDALVAAVSLNVFNNHCRRVKMANIAQTINVLQAMILTDKEKMIVTPTYHVFEMYTVHHDATMLPLKIESAEYHCEGVKLPAVHGSASRNDAGQIHVTLCNLDPNRPAKVSAELVGAKAGAIAGRVLTADTMQAHNTFEQPHAVEPKEFSGAAATEKGFSVELPPKSVVVLKLN